MPATTDSTTTRHLPPAHRASVRRHPSSATAWSGDCGRCGFQRPRHTDIAAAIALLPAEWRRPLEERRPGAFADAARLRDELHVVTNRIERIRAVPGAPIVAPLPTVMPTPRHRITSSEHLVTLLQLAAERLVETLTRLDADEWQLHGRLGSEDVTIEQLAVMPLHRSHARLKGAPKCT